jgi:hypothetical protein
MSLKSFLQSLIPGSGTRESVSLNPTEQMTLRFLLTYGSATRETLATEVMSSRVMADTELNEGLSRLQTLGLVEIDSNDLFVASKRAARLKRHIPLEPQTVTEYYL